MRACSTSSCLTCEIVVDSSCVLAVKTSLPEVEMARLVVQRDDGEQATVSGCLCCATDTLDRLFSVT